jgi:hypothetical protein
MIKVTLGRKLFCTCHLWISLASKHIYYGGFEFQPGREPNAATDSLRQGWRRPLWLRVAIDWFGSAKCQRINGLGTGCRQALPIMIS